MQELSLNILDIVQNSIRAHASLITIRIILSEIDKKMTILVEDDGDGMSKETVEQVINPFYTSRTTRSVGLGVPFFKMSAEMTGGSFRAESELGAGTTFEATYRLDHIDLMPLGDMASTMLSLVSANPDIDFVYEYSVDGRSFTLDTREVKEVLEGLPVNSPDVLVFIKEFIEENTKHVETVPAPGE